MDEFKNCDNCSLLIHKEDKFICKKMHFVSVRKQEFFYNPDRKEKSESFFLNKYITLSNAIECEDYDPIQYIAIINIEFRKPIIEKYGDILVNVRYKSSGAEKTILYSKMSYESKTRNYFSKVKKYIDFLKECSGNTL